MTKARTRDQFLYALLAAVFAAVAVIAIWSWMDSGGRLASKVAPVQILGARTANELMQELSKTVDDGGQADIMSVRQEANGL
jgi:hypothetical protein